MKSSGGLNTKEFKPIRLLPSMQIIMSKRTRIILALLLLGQFLLLSQTTLQGQAMFMGNFKSIKKSGQEILIKAENASLQIRYYSPTIIRIRIDKDIIAPDFSYAVVARPEAGEFKLRENGEKIVLLTDSLRIEIRKNPIRIHIKNNKERVLSEEYPPFGTGWQGSEISCYRKLFPDEKFIGLGEKTGNLNRRDNAYEMWNSDVPAYAAIADPLYVSIPFFMGIHDSLTYGIFLDNSSRTKFDFAASADNLFSRFSVAEGELNYYFFGASTIAGILNDYTWLTGRTPLPPYWSLGFQQCRWSYYPDTEVLSVAKQFRAKKIPCDMIYLDIDYMDSYKIFTWNPKGFANPRALISELNGLGFHVATIVDPGIKVEPGYFAYDVGLKNDYFVKYPDGVKYIGSVWPGRCHFPDFTRDAVRQWWGVSFKYLVDPGVEGFWNDMNEPSAWGQNIPDIVQFDFDGHGASMKQAHNVYGLNMSRATYEGTRKLLKGKRPFVLTRAGYAGIQRYSAIWTGDNVASDEHMLLSARMVNSMGLSGLSFVGPDMGGFMGTPSKELFVRWLSLGVYTPFFRNHAAKGTNRKEPWSLGEGVEESSVKLISQRYRLLPYIYSAFYTSTQSGLPVARSLAINYTNDEKIWWWKYQEEYLFGDNLLVAPVSCTQNFARVYLPEGGWYRLSSGEFFQGKQELNVEAPLDDLPVFVRASGILPMQSVIQNTSEKPSDTLDLHIYAGKNANSYVFYEDDGQTYNYEKGAFCKRLIRFDPAGKTIFIGKAEGSFTSRFTKMQLILHGFPGLKTLKVNGHELNLQKSDPSNQSVILLFNSSELSIHFE